MKVHLKYPDVEWAVCGTIGAKVFTFDEAFATCVRCNAFVLANYVWYQSLLRDNAVTKDVLERALLRSGIDLAQQNMVMQLVSVGMSNRRKMERNNVANVI